MKTEMMYSLAIRRRENQNDHFWMHKDYVFEECSINCHGRYWLADPFLFEKDGNMYLFFEAFDLVDQLGKIGYSVMSEDGTFSDPKIIIDKKYHMSFPHIFEYGGEIYIMPESCGDWRVRLFKAKQFPDVWEEAEILLPDVYACDSIIIDAKDGEWLLTNEMYHNTPNGTYGSCWVKNYLYKMEGLTVQETGTKVAEGDFGIRNAGKSFYMDNTLYRIGQDCRNKEYGRGMALFTIESLSPYKETMKWSLDYKEIEPHIKFINKKALIGTHTYNFSERFEIIDMSFDKPVGSFTRVKRLIRYLMVPFNNK